MLLHMASSSVCEATLGVPESVVRPCDSKVDDEGRSTQEQSNSCALAALRPQSLGIGMLPQQTHLVDILGEVAHRQHLG
eukprot:scaffold7306_cov31-Tisochrysis_lutea.AAC.5